MIRHYTFNYDMYEAEASFRVDTLKFTEKIAKELLEFFTWKYDKEADPIDELLNKYAMTSIKIATAGNYNVYGVKDEFKDMEGFPPMDGSLGIELMTVTEYEFDESKLDVTIVTD